MNEMLGEFEIEIGGKVRPFRFSMLEAYKIDRVHLKTGEKSVLQLSADSINVPLLVDVMHIGLAAHEPGLKVETVAMWLTRDADKLQQYFEFLGKAVTNLFGRGNKQAEDAAAPLGDDAAPKNTSSSAAPGAAA